VLQIYVIFGGLTNYFNIDPLTDIIYKCLPYETSAVLHKGAIYRGLLNFFNLDTVYKRLTSDISAVFQIDAIYKGALNYFNIDTI
jgi:phage shock protein PspC (stress-responsive transcriptional regulator)